MKAPLLDAYFNAGFNCSNFFTTTVLYIGRTVIFLINSFTIYLSCKLSLTTAKFFLNRKLTTNLWLPWTTIWNSYLMSLLLFLFMCMQRSLFRFPFLFTGTHSECSRNDFLVYFLTQFSKKSLNQIHRSYTSLISLLNH